MDKGLLILLAILIVCAPIAYFLGIKAYIGILLILGGLALFVFVMMYAYWYIFEKKEG
jgi:hypothetical protein